MCKMIYFSPIIYNYAHYHQAHYMQYTIAIANFIDAVAAIKLFIKSIIFISTTLLLNHNSLFNYSARATHM